MITTQLKQRAIDLVTLTVAALVLLGAYYLYGTITRHHQLVDEITGFFADQRQAQQAPIQPDPALVEPIPEEPR